MSQDTESRSSEKPAWVSDFRKAIIQLVVITVIGGAITYFFNWRRQISEARNELLEERFTVLTETQEILRTSVLTLKNYYISIREPGSSDDDVVAYDKWKKNYYKDFKKSESRIRVYFSDKAGDDFEDVFLHLRDFDNIVIGSMEEVDRQEGLSGAEIKESLESREIYDNFPQKDKARAEEIKANGYGSLTGKIQVKADTLTKKMSESLRKAYPSILEEI